MFRVVIVGLMIVGMFMMGMAVSGRSILVYETRMAKTDEAGQNVIVCNYFSGVDIVERRHYRFDIGSFERYECPSSIDSY